MHSGMCGCTRRRRRKYRYGRVEFHYARARELLREWRWWKLKWGVGKKKRREEGEKGECVYTETESENLADLSSQLVWRFFSLLAPVQKHEICNSFSRLHFKAIIAVARRLCTGAIVLEYASYFASLRDTEYMIMHDFHIHLLKCIFEIIKIWYEFQSNDNAVLMLDFFF